MKTPKTLSRSKLSYLTSTLLFLVTFGLFGLTAQIAGATRIISLSGDLNFGNVLVGSTAQRTYTISNLGNQNMTVQSIVYPAGFTGNFQSGSIKPGKSQVVTVTFAPTNAASYGGEVVVNCNKTSGDNTIEISGTGTNPPPTRVISLSGHVTFGEVEVGTSAQWTLFITNSGNSTLTVSNISYPTGFSGAFSGTIAAGQVQPVTVTFSPTDAITYSGTVTVNSDATSGANSVSISGTGVETPPTTRVISLSGAITFGEVEVGTSAQWTLFITNNGNSTLTVSNINYPAGFSGAFSGAIPAGEAQPVTVTFSPTDTIVYSGTVTVDSDATSGDNSVAISGTGVETPEEAPGISLSGDLHFGDVEVDSSAQLTLFITNTGNAALTVSNISYPDGFSGDWASGTIAAGDVQSVTITFSPTDTVAYGGTVTVDSDAVSGANSIEVSGTGVAEPYAPRKAVFSGLFYPSSEPGFENSGYVSANTAIKGKIKLKILLAGKKHNFTGLISPAGEVSGTIFRKDNTPLTVSLEIHGDTISGTISDGVWTADLVAQRNVFNKKSNTAPQAGIYSVTILGSNDAEQGPTANGTGTVLITPAGVVKFAGTLGDGTKVSQSTTISANGEWPLYLPLYSGGGALTGWLNFNGEEGEEVNGLVNWFKLPHVDPANYPDGFGFQTSVTGFRN